MKIIKQVSIDEVVQAWLEAEWPSPERDSIRDKVPASLIAGKDFDNIQSNRQRLEVLRSWRYPIIDPLPQETVWYLASYDKEDIQRTYIVPSNDWATISSNMYHPLKIMENLNLDDGHAKKINEIKAALSTNRIDRRIILVGSDINSFLTMIEGNHRGTAIFIDALERNAQNPILEEVFIGISPQMKSYIFHIEKHMMPQAVR